MHDLQLTAEEARFLAHVDQSRSKICEILKSQTPAQLKAFIAKCARAQFFEMTGAERVLAGGIAAVGIFVLLEVEIIEKPS